jgi:hypothetical protein
MYIEKKRIYASNQVTILGNKYIYIYTTLDWYSQDHKSVNVVKKINYTLVIHSNTEIFMKTLRRAKAKTYFL